MRGLVFGAALFSTLASALAGGTQTLTIAVDGERSLSFEQPVSKLFIKDSTVVDAIAVDRSHALLTGKRNGITTVQAVDANGQRVAIYRVVVGTPPRRAAVAAHAEPPVVTLQRGSERIEYVCGRDHCKPISRIGMQLDGAGASGAGPASASAQNTAPSPGANGSGQVGGGTVSSIPPSGTPVPAGGH